MIDIIKNLWVFARLPILGLIIIIIAITIFAIAMIVRAFTKDNTQLRRIVTSTIATITIIMCACGGVNISRVLTTARQHQARVPDILSYAYTELVDDNTNSPVADTLPDDLSGKLIIFYKYGCPDCEGIYQELTKMLDKNNVDALWISTDTDEGKELANTYYISWVPTGIYFYNDSSNRMGNSLSMALDDLESMSHNDMDEDNVQTLIDAYLEQE